MYGHTNKQADWLFCLYGKCQKESLCLMKLSHVFHTFLHACHNFINLCFYNADKVNVFV